MKKNQFIIINNDHFNEVINILLTLTRESGEKRSLKED